MALKPVLEKAILRCPAIQLLINLRTGLLTDHKDLQGIGKEDENEGEERLLTSGFG